MNPPQHFNTVKSSQTFYWSGKDTENYFKDNLKNSQIKSYFESHGWDNNTSIEYTYNQYGYRDKEFTDCLSYIALGCSITEGVGVKLEQTWPYLLSKKINYPIWNLGVGGCGLQTCYRILEYWIEHLNVKGVFLLSPPNDRFEMFHNNHWGVYNINSQQLPDIYKFWVAQEENIAIQQKIITAAIENICRNTGVAFYVFNDWDSQVIDSARDIEPCNKHRAHPGPKSQENFARTFYNLYLKNK
jgi:hypothetical protein